MLKEMKRILPSLPFVVLFLSTLALLASLSLFSSVKQSFAIVYDQCDCTGGNFTCKVKFGNRNARIEETSTHSCQTGRRCQESTAGSGQPIGSDTFRGITCVAGTQRTGCNCVNSGTSKDFTCGTARGSCEEPPAQNGGPGDRTRTTNTVCIEGDDSKSYTTNDGSTVNKGISCQGTESATGNDIGVGCTCEHPNDAGNDRNNFTCPNIKNDDGSPKVVSCDKRTCFNTADSTLTVDGNSYKGISCGDQAIRKNCRCINPGEAGSGKNGYECDPLAGNTNKHTSYCEKTEHACNDSTGDPSTNKEGPDKTEVTVEGIFCGQPAMTDCVCDEPVGKTGSGNNGYTCQFQGKSVHDFCEKPEHGCVPRPGEAHNNKSGTYGEVLLGGIICAGEDDPVVEAANDLPPPPPPPCAPGATDAEGKCTAVEAGIFGTFSTNPGELTVRTFGILLSLSGGLGLLLYMRAVYRILWSRGDQNMIQTGQQELVAVTVGMVFLIFSFIFLQVIVVDILRIPGVTGGGAGDPGTNPAAANPVDHCTSCEEAAACTARGGSSRGTLDCTGGRICCE